MTTPEPTPPPGQPAAHRPRALALLGGALVVAAGVFVFASGGEDAAPTSTPARSTRSDEAVEAPQRAPLRAPGVKRRAPEEREARPPPDNLGEVEALLEEDPRAALEWIETLAPANDGEAEQLEALEIRALVEVGRLGKARARAKDYYERWPHGASTPLLEQLTGVRRDTR